MICPTEFTCALFTDGELPEAEAREIARHLETCKACDRLVAVLRAESRMLVQCLQDIDLDESGEVATASSQPIGVVTFAFGVIALALAFRLSTGILFGLDVPQELQWFSPRQWLLNLGIAVNAALYAIQSADLFVSGAVQTTALLAFGSAALVVMARVLKRSAAASSIFAVLMVIGLSSSPGYAIDTRKGAAASIAASETVDDSLLAAPDEKVKNIDIAGTIKGDLLVVGDVVTISGTVEGNVLAFGRRVEVSGTVGGSLAGAAETVEVTGHVSRNLIAAGSKVNLGKTAEVAGNAIAAGSDSMIEGKVARDLIIGAGTMVLRGDIARNVFFAGGQASLSPTAHVGGNLNAKVQKEEQVSIATGAVIGGNRNISLTRAEPRQSRYLSLRFYIWQVVRILAAFVTGVLLFKLIPSLVPSRIVSGMDWLKAGGIGFIALVTIPVAFIILAITVIGLPIALLSLALWAAGLYFSKIMVAEFVGRSVTKTGGAVSLLAGLVLVIFAVNLPWIGTLINFLLMLAGLGAIAVMIYKSTFARRTVEI